MRRLAMHPDGFVAVRATAALGALGEPGTLSALRRALASPEPGVRRVAVMAWSDALQGGADCDPLAPLLGDPDRSVALMAAVQIVLIAAR
jgi:HEAT repeat protein